MIHRGSSLCVLVRMCVCSPVGCSSSSPGRQHGTKQDKREPGRVQGCLLYWSALESMIHMFSADSSSDQAETRHKKKTMKRKMYAISTHESDTVIYTSMFISVAWTEKWHFQRKRNRKKWRNLSGSFLSNTVSIFHFIMPLCILDLRL